MVGIRSVTIDLRFLSVGLTGSGWNAFPVGHSLLSNYLNYSWFLTSNLLILFAKQKSIRLAKKIDNLVLTSLFLAPSSPFLLIRAPTLFTFPCVCVCGSLSIVVY